MSDSSSFRTQVPKSKALIAPEKLLVQRPPDLCSRGRSALNGPKPTSRPKAAFVRALTNPGGE